LGNENIGNFPMLFSWTTKFPLNKKYE
jgi:hypothetical protein